MNYEEEEIETCSICDGTGRVEVLSHVTGDNIMPGGYYEGSGVFRKCECKMIDEFEHSDHYSFKQLSNHE